MARTGQRGRITCESCGLPFYADEGSCPYCRGPDVLDELGTPGEPGFVFDTVESSEAARTVCPECNLLHYENSDGCPYCDFAGREAEFGTNQGSADDGSAETRGDLEQRSNSQGDNDRGGSLVGRFRRMFGL